MPMIDFSAMATRPVKQAAQTKVHPLTSIRFFAAFYVVLYHTRWGVTPGSALDQSLSMGTASVSFFFLLSGYILALVYLRDGQPVPKRKFYVARFARIYPLYFAAGAVARFSWARQILWRNVLSGAYALLLITSLILFLPLSIPVLPVQKFLAYEHRLGYKPQDSETHDATILPQFYADRFGWTDLVEQVNAIYHALPPNEQAITGIFAGNYGQASAINILGEHDGLPTAISGHQNYWIWGPRGYTGQETIIITESSPEEMSQYYASCKVMAMRANPLAMPWEKGPIYLCHGRKAGYAADWKDLKYYY